MKKRILYIILGLILLSNVGMGQSFTFDVSSGYNIYPAENCDQVIFSANNPSSSSISLEIYYSNDGIATYNRLPTGYSIPANSSDYTFPVFQTGFYSVKWKNGAVVIQTSDPKRIVINPLPNATVAVPSTICNGVSVLLGAAEVLGNTYSWSSNVGTFSSTISNPSVSPSSTQTYILTEFITATGCSNSNDVAITVNPIPTVTAITPQIKCNTIASDVINFSGTVSNTTYAWTNSQLSIGIAASGSGTISSTTLINLTNSPIIGTITVTPTANSCPGPSGTFTITVNPTPTVAPIVPQIRCNTIASDVINFSGTVTGTTYAWTNSQSSIGIAASGSGTISSTTLINLTNSQVIGTITVTPTVNSCAGLAGTFSITVNPLPARPILTSQTICEGVTATITGPTGTYTYTWQVPSGVAISTTKSVTTTKAGTYTLTITDANTCTSEVGTATVFVNALPAKPTLSSPIICEGETASITMLTPTGTSSYTYTWTVPAGVASSISNTVSTTKAGTYSLTITDANTCTSDVGTTTVTVNPLPARPILTSQTICEGVTATITGPTGTYTYTWQVPTGVATSTTNTINTTKAGTYSLSITDANSCTSEAGTGTVTVNALPPKPTLTSPVICEGETASVTMLTPTGTSTYTYTWTVPTGVATSTTKSVSTSKAGTYSLSITDANSCTSEVGTATVSVNALPPKPTLTSPVICEGATATITGPTGTYTYTWTVPTGVATSTTKTVSTNKAGTYSLTITDANSCTSEVGSAIVTVNPLPAKPTLTNQTICEGVTTTITGPTGTYTYTWQVPSGVATSTTKSVSTNKAGTYSLTITDANTCTSDVGTATITVNALPSKPTLTSPVICEGATATVTMSTPTGTNTYTYNWQVPTGVATSTSNSVTTTKAGTYSLTITDANTCTSEVGIGTLTVNPLPTLTITNPSAVCAPGSVDLTATAITAGSTSSLTYTYFNNAAATTSLTNANTISTTGAYYIKGTTALNCSAIKAVNATINPIPTFTLTSPSVCLGSPLTITANPITGAKPDYNYTWQVPSGVTNPGNVSSFPATTAGVYTATIKNKITNCESASLNNNAIFYPLPIAKTIVASDNKVIVNKTLALSAAASGGTSPYRFTWTPNPTMYYSISGQENAVFNALKEGKVNIKYQVKDANNCEVNSSDYEITIESEDIVLVLPNAFTPNGNNNNDQFKIAASNMLGKTSFRSLEIYNRNGKLMFRTEDITEGWDGRYKDVMQDMGVYFVKLVKLNKDRIQVVETTPIYLLK